MSAPIRVTIWNEFVHERTNEAVKHVYPEGIHAVIAQALHERLSGQVVVRAATLNEPEHGLTKEVLHDTDVLLWWGHAAHDQVSNKVVKRVHKRVLRGMGLIALHSAHASKVFCGLMGTSCMLRWREAGERERLWIVAPGHPITAGLTEEYFELEHTEMYGEHFDIPTPDELIFLSWFEGGEVFRSGCTWRRGAGKIFYFRPGHETYPIYYDANVRRVLANAVLWAAPSGSTYLGKGRNIRQSLSPIQNPLASHDELHVGES